MENNYEKDRNISFAQKVISKVRTILNKYMDGFAGYKELQDFMSDDNNLYKSDGTLTEEYKKKIAEVEEYIKSNSVDDTIFTVIGKSEEDKEVIQGIIDFVERRKEIIQKYTEEENLFGEDFNAEHFVNEMLTKHASNPEERAQIIGIMENLAEKDALDALDEETVRDGFKKVINFKGM